MTRHACDCDVDCCNAVPLWALAAAIERRVAELRADANDAETRAEIRGLRTALDLARTHGVKGGR